MGSGYDCGGSYNCILMELRKETEYLIIHCAATKPSMDIGLTEIRKWHLDRGWRDVGRRNDDMGAHASGYNHKSIGVCLVGGMADDNSAEDNFTDRQWTALLDLVKQIQVEYNDINIIGHNEVSTKECPSFDVQKWKTDNL